VREWASQALKNGADILRWYTDGNQETAPGCYEEMIRVSRIVRKMKPLALPEKSKVAILYSYIAQWGKFDIEQNAEYSLYVILGEQLHSFFKFVSDVEIDDNRAKAGDYNTIIAPNLKYLDKITAAKLVEFVEKGGRLIVLDPEAFAYARDGSSLQSVRDVLIGNGQPAKKSAKNILLNGKEASVEVAFATTIPQGAKVIASYADKTPAAFERKVGKGSVVYFAATPFTSARITARPGEWSNYLASEMKKAGEHFDYKHWDFMIPKAEKK
jgi:beta-galactosidase GanA